MLITKELINMNLQGTTKQEAIRNMAQLAQKAGRVKDIDEFIQAVLKREEEFTTGVGFGVAIPHGKTDAVTEPFLAFCKTQPIDWKSMDEAPVTMIFLIGVPKNEAGTEHLKILANISRKLMKKDFRQKLEEAGDEEAILKLLEEIQ